MCYLTEDMKAQHTQEIETMKRQYEDQHEMEKKRWEMDIEEHKQEMVGKGNLSSFS